MKKRNLFLNQSIFLLTSIFFFLSCEKETRLTNDVHKSTTEYEGFSGNNKGEIREIEYLGNMISVQDAGDYYIFLGDIRLKKSDVDSANKQSKLKSAAVNYRRWPNNTVYYRIQNGFINPQRITEAIQRIQNNTNVTFVYSTTASNYIEIINSSYIYSDWIGCKKGRQEIGLTATASYGNAIHEFCHALGLFHEQSRTDRDNFISVNFNNIHPDLHSQYYTYTASGYNGFDFETFDFGSIMLYPSDNSYNGNWTMTDLAGNPFSAQRISLSNIDIRALNFLYPRTISVTIKGPTKVYNSSTMGSIWTVSISNGTPPYTYSWEYLDLNHFNQYSTESSIDELPLRYGAPGVNLRVTVTDSRGLVGVDTHYVVNVIQ